MKSIPQYYRSFFRFYLRYAIIMMIFGLLIGILFQESSKKAPVSAVLPPGMHLETVFNLALVHGHTFLVGALIPLAVLWMLFLGLQLGYQPISHRALKWGSLLYIPGATVAILLMLYKGYHFLLGVRFGQLDFEVLNQTLFMGSHALRASVYGLSHSAMAIGLGILVISFWKRISKSDVEV